MSSAFQRDPLAWLWYRPYTRPHRSFEVKTKDGVAIRGVHLASGHDSLIIYCHGFLGSKNYTVVTRFVEMLAEEADAISFDFRGHGESEGHSTIGVRELLDLAAVVDYARREGYRKIYLVGSSMGGATSLRYAASDPIIAGVATIGAFAHPGLTRTGELGLWLAGRAFARTAANAVRRCRISPGLNLPSPLAVVGQISPRPLLLIHGEFDPLVPVQQARELYAAAHEPKELIIVPHGDHDIPNLRRWTKDWIMDWIRANEGRQVNK